MICCVIDNFIEGHIDLNLKYSVTSDSGSKRYFIFVDIEPFRRYPNLTKKELIFGGYKIIEKNCLYSRQIKAPVSNVKIGISELQEIIDYSVVQNAKLLKERGYEQVHKSDNDLFKQQSKFFEDV